MNKYKSHIISIGVIVLFLVGLVLLGGSSAKDATTHGTASLVEPDSSAALRTELSFYDFGTISMGAGKVTREFAFKNASDKAVTLGKLYTSCMCTEVTLVKGGKKIGPFGMPGHGSLPALGETMEAGEEGVLEVVFDPAAHGPAGIGKAERAVYLEYGEGLPLQVGFSAFVTP